jgi:hypothetical protein
MRRLFIALAFSTLLVACEPPTHPGESVGTFQVNGSLDENLCGAAVPALDPISFSVEIRDQLGRAMWIMDEQPVQDGIRMPDGTYRFRSGTTVPVLEPQPGYRGCSLQQVELVEVTISSVPADGVVDESDAGVGMGGDDDALEIDGLSEVQFTPTIDSDCSPLPVVNGGPWAALPCTITYTLFGTGVGPGASVEEEATEL